MIIGLGFRARSGKDTVASYLTNRFGFHSIAFADPLKRACKEIFGFTDDQVYGDLKETIDSYWGFSPRYALQKVGTECMRDGFDRNIWVKAVEKRILADPFKNWVITDCRFPNEAAAIKEWGGMLIEVDRPDVGASTGIEKHASEVAMEQYDGWDHVFRNHGTLQDLYDLVDSFMTEPVVWTQG